MHSMAGTEPFCRKGAPERTRVKTEDVWQICRIEQIEIELEIDGVFVLT